MAGLKIMCYCDCDECADRDPTGWCGRFDRMCEEVHADAIVEDGEEYFNAKNANCPFARAGIHRAQIDKLRPLEPDIGRLKTSGRCAGGDGGGMIKNNEWVIPALGRCMDTEGCSPTDCRGYEHCIGEGREIMKEGAAVVEQLVGRAQEMIEAMAGIRQVYLYFATKAPIDADKLPEEGYIAHVNHEERKYIRLIDDMAYGTAVYRRPLKPFELVALRLTSAPRD